MCCWQAQAHHKVFLSGIAAAAAAGVTLAKFPSIKSTLQNAQLQKNIIVVIIAPTVLGRTKVLVRKLLSPYTYTQSLFDLLAMSQTFR